MASTQQSNMKKYIEIPSHSSVSLRAYDCHLSIFYDCDLFGSVWTIQMFSICLKSLWSCKGNLTNLTFTAPEPKKHFSSERCLHWQAMRIRFQPCLAECLESREVIHVSWSPSCLMAMSLVRCHFWDAIWNTLPITHATPQPSEVIVITQSCSGNLRSHGGLPNIGPFLVGKWWT